MLVLGISLFTLPFIIRFIQIRKFLKNLSVICHMYDWKIVDEEPEKLLEILKENYYEQNILCDAVLPCKHQARR